MRRKRLPALEQKKKSDDEACGRLLEVYVQEAKQYDEGLVKSWKEDMDVTLVFSGLYSAVLTAFVIESYQKLQEDPADASVALLRQLVSLSNNTNIVTEDHMDKFTPTQAAVACNILWFLSLIPALCCAFLATFVQQWSRQFLHKTGLRRSSTAHARLFSFLYFGIKNFQMHSVVNVIPSMLHLSLFLFLGGLIAFLRDVNLLLTCIVGVALALVSTIYTGFTIWPLIALNSPYQTPLSPMAWKLWRALSRDNILLTNHVLERFKHTVPHSITWASHIAILPILPTIHFPKRPPSIWRRFKFLAKSWSTTIRAASAFLKTLPILPVVYEPTHRVSFMQPLTPDSESDTNHVNSSVHEALEVSSQPGKLLDLADEVLAASQKFDPKRDVQCITWTLSSLTNDQELFPFVEALPDAIYGPNFIMRDNNLHLLKALVETMDPQRDIILRIASLMSNASNSWFDEKHRVRCSIACPKALWALALMFEERRDQFDLVKTSRKYWFPEHLLKALEEGSRPELGSILDHKFALSAGVLCVFEYQITSKPAGLAISQFLNTSSEVEPFEFERTSQALSEYLSRHTMSVDLLTFPLCTYLEVPRIHNNDPLPPGQIARLDVVIGLCLQLPKLYDSDIYRVLEYIYTRAEMDGWGATRGIWNNCKSLRALDGCSASREFCNVMREYRYTLLPHFPFNTLNIDPLLLVCVRILQENPTNVNDEESDTSRIALETMVAMRVVVADALEEPSTSANEQRCTAGALRTETSGTPLVPCIRKLAEHSAHANDKNSDTSQIALETMITMKVVLVDAPQEGVEVSEDFEVVCQYVKQNVLRLGAESRTWDDPFYGEDVKAGRVVALTARLLKRFLLSADDPVATRDILDALESIQYIGCVNDLFDTGPDGLPLQRAVGGGLSAIFSNVTLELCQWWTKNPSESLTRNALDIVARIWQVWGHLELPQSEEATRNLSKAAKLMLYPESMNEVERWKSERASSVHDPLGIAQYRDEIFSKRFDFDGLLSRYKNLRSDDESMHSQASTAPSDIPNHPGDSATVEEGPGIAQDRDDGSKLSSSIPWGSAFLPLTNDRWVI